MSLARVDLTTLSQQQAAEYRQELINAIWNPGSEFDEVGEEGTQDREDYETRLAEVDAYLAGLEG